MTGLVQHSNPTMAAGALLAVVSVLPTVVRGAVQIWLKQLSSEYMITKSACRIAEEKKDPDSLDALVALASVYQGTEKQHPLIPERMASQVGGELAAAGGRPDDLAVGQ